VEQVSSILASRKLTAIWKKHRPNKSSHENV